MLNRLQLQHLELQLQNLDQPLCLKSEQKCSFRTKRPLPNLQQTVANAIIIINISNSNNFNKFWVGIFYSRVTSIKFTKQEWVSQSVSQLVSDKHSQWSDSGPIIIYLLPKDIEKLGRAGAQVAGSHGALQKSKTGTQLVLNPQGRWTGSVEGWVQGVGGFLGE